MDSIPLTDAAQVVLIIEPTNEVGHRMADIPRNKPHLRAAVRVEPPTVESRKSRESTPWVEPKSVFLELRLDRPPMKQGEWVFGSSSDENGCDIQIAADQKSGVSRQQFKIHHNVHTGVLLIANLSRRGTSIRLHREFELLRTTQILVADNPVCVRAGALQLNLIIPYRTQEVETQHLRYLQQFFSNYRDSIIQSISTPITSVPEAEITPAVVSLDEAEIDIVLRKDIGQGQFGAVHIGIDRNTGKTFAVKIIDKVKLEKAHFENAQKRLESEKILAGMISHDNIIQFRHVKDKESTITIVMELAVLGDLARHMHSEPFSVEEVYIIAKQQCSAISYLHDLGVTHRDIKPGNILLESRKPLLTRLADFGESSLSPQLQTYAGTVVYMAPELEEKGMSDLYTNKVDVWSLGLVLVQLLQPETPIEHLYTLPLRYRGTLAELTRKMLQEDPAIRFSARQCTEYISSHASASWTSSGTDIAESNDEVISGAKKRKKKHIL